jgi:hypothetical protein
VPGVIPPELQPLIEAMRECRRLQRQFFAGNFKSGDERGAVIRSAKAAEKRVDKLLAELDAGPPVQGDMFGGGR